MYQFTVWSTNATGIGGSTSNTLLTPPALPQFLRAFTTTSNMNIFIQSTSVYNPVYYTFTQSLTNARYTYYADSTNTSALFRLTGLTAGTAYYYTVTSSNAAGYGDTGVFGPYWTTPAAVTGFASGAITSSNIQLLYTPAVGALSYSIVSSNIYGNMTTQVAAGASSSYLFSNLDPASTYKFIMTSSNASGLGGAVISSPFTTSTLYTMPFTFTFTTMGATGPSGPTSIQYSSIPGDGTLSKLQLTSTGIQLWTVPQTGLYQFIAAGAAGKSGGNGAVVINRYTLTVGQIIKILVGQSGTSMTNSTGKQNYGGGGGTFVTKGDNTPILVAGGGGGNDAGGYNICNGILQPSSAQTGPIGNAAANPSSYSGVLGGAGFYSDSVYPGSSIVIRSFINGGTSCNIGGFGGGGGYLSDSTAIQNFDSGGGGGGYSGGNGSALNNYFHGIFTTYSDGYGGGSYDVTAASASPVAYTATAYTGTLPTAVASQVSGGYNTGQGFVVVSQVMPLDLLTPAAQSSLTGVYAVKQLFAAYTGSVLNLRRNTDNASNNFNADAYGNLTTSSGTSFSSWMTGATTAYVTTWYDQSGNAVQKNAVQTNTALQPIYDSVNKCIDFTNGGYFSIPSNGVVPFANNPYTISFKYTYPQSTITSNPIYSAGSGTNKSAFYLQAPSPYHTYLISAGGSIQANPQSLQTITSGNIIVTSSYDGTTFVANSLNLYINHSITSLYYSIGTPTTADTANYIGYCTPSYKLNTQLYYIVFANTSFTSADRGILESI